MEWKLHIFLLSREFVMKDKKSYLQKFSNKYWLPGIVLCAFCLLLPSYGKAQEENISGIPSYGGKLEISPQKELLPEKEMPALSTDVENQEIGTPEQTGTTKKTEKAKTNTPDRSTANDIILQTNRVHSLIVEENGSNLLTTKSSKLPETYSNSTQLNNGFYMNITNSDGSSMNFGTYFNSNTSSNGPRRKSSSQIIVDKK